MLHHRCNDMSPRIRWWAKGDLTQRVTQRCGTTGTPEAGSRTVSKWGGRDRLTGMSWGSAGIQYRSHS